MPKKILLIENDAAFAGTASGALEAAGFGVRVAPDGKEGLDLAREWAPDGIVLCVELPGMSGYLVCQKLRKDDALKAIPLVITSAEATQATFENHKKLKVRADEYLLKPYDPAALVDVLGALVGLPEPEAAVGLEIEPAPEEPAFELGLDAAPAGDADEELVTLEEEVGIEALGGEAVGDLPSLDLQGLPEDPDAGAGSSDEDLRLLDDAFDGLAAPPADDDPGAALDLALEAERPVEVDELDAAAASLQDDSGRDRLDRLGDEADALLGALGGPDLDPGPAFEDDRPASRPTMRASPDALRAALDRSLEQPPARAPFTAAAAPAPSAASARLEGELAEARAALESQREATAAREAELAQLQDRVAALTARAEEAEAGAGSLRSRVDALSGELDAARAEATEARGAAASAARRAAELERRAEEAEARSQEAGRRADEAARRADDSARRADEASRRADEAEAALRRKDEELEAALAAGARAEALERELEDARTEVLVARGEADGARGEVEKRTTELRRRLQELEAANAKNEERILKAYQKIKGDEKVREKLRKAIAIAGQLLDEGLAPEPSAADKARAALSPRE